MRRLHKEIPSFPWYIFGKSTTDYGPQVHWNACVQDLQEYEIVVHVEPTHSYKEFGVMYRVAVLMTGEAHGVKGVGCIGINRMGDPYLRLETLAYLGGLPPKMEDCATLDDEVYPHLCVKVD